MKDQASIDYNRIAKAIDYIKTHFKEQPTLDEVANAVHLSPFHLQRMFTEWAGVSPKKFLQYISVEHAKRTLSAQQPTLFDVATEVGLSSTSRLHDLFVTIEGMTPGEYKNGGKDLLIQYEFVDSPFGKLLVACTSKGICYMGFADDDNTEDLTRRFPNARYVAQKDIAKSVAGIFNDNWTGVKLHLKGTGFQLKVWETLLKIPMGQLATYGSIAEGIQSPKASRAVGTAIGSNPVGFLIPCHRVIRASGVIGDYMWGSTRKMAIIGWEAARVNKEQE
ncbi:MAG: methylated-DNA--[protein]-cysteine S-methyltransferase [Flavipsychrobacter sp.]